MNKFMDGLKGLNEILNVQTFRTVTYMWRVLS